MFRGQLTITDYFFCTVDDHGVDAICKTAHKHVRGLRRSDWERRNERTRVFFFFLHGVREKQFDVVFPLLFGRCCVLHCVYVCVCVCLRRES